MFKELINTLSFMYCFTARSRGKLGQQELDDQVAALKVHIKFQSFQFLSCSLC